MGTGLSVGHRVRKYLISKGFSFGREPVEDRVDIGANRRKSGI
jgi:hypothetical protein